VNFADLRSDGSPLLAAGRAPAAPGPEARALSIGDLRAINGLDGPEAPASVRVTPDSALRFIPVFAAVNRLATDCAVLPLAPFRARAGGGRDALQHPAYRLLNLTPDGETTAMAFRQALLGHLLTCDRGAFAEIEWTKDGELGALYLLDPRTTRAERTPQSKKLYYRIDNGKSLPPYKVLHIAGLGFNGLEQYSRVAMGARGIGLGVAAEAFGGSFFANGSRPSGALTTAQKLSPEARKELREAWQARQGGVGNVGSTAILDQGLDWKPHTVVPEEGQFDETRRYQRTEVAGLFGVPPSKIGDFSEAHLANIEAANRDYVETALVGLIRPFEAACNLKLFRRDEQDAGCYLKHNLNALLRGNVAARTEFYVAGLNNGWLTVNEVRSLEDMNPIPADAGGDLHWHPLNMGRLDQAGTPPPPGATADGNP
jgi:HK97 family phage portal protein